jgi:hypothetical protein
MIRRHLRLVGQPRRIQVEADLLANEWSNHPLTMFSNNSVICKSPW